MALTAREIAEVTPRDIQEADDWQIVRVQEGLAAARDGRVRPAEDVFAEIAAKHSYLPGATRR